MFLGVAFGPMGAGKSTYLYDKYRAFSKRDGTRILGITHVYDNRYDDMTGANICTHTKMRIPAIKVDRLTDVDISEYDVILIDEGQFYPDLYEFVKSNMHRSIHMYVAGLDGDATQHKFGQILDILPLASEKIAKYGICDICGNNASFTRKKVVLNTTTDQNDPGGFDKYYTVCHKHLYDETKWSIIK